MPALAPQYMSVLKKILAERFVPFLPPLLGAAKPDDRAAKQLSRAFSAFVLHKLLDIPPQAAAASVVDDFNDKGIDAVHYDEGAETLYLLQSKLKETVQEVSRIKQMLFGGFERCLYDFQKFDSDTERRFAVILERDALKWLKPVKGQFQIFYKMGVEQPEYVPDFVAETSDCVLMAETKASADVATQEVQAKAAAAVRWCQHASEYSASVGGKPWKYLLVPHDEINEAKRLGDYLRYEIRSDKG